MTKIACEFKASVPSKRAKKSRERKSGLECAVRAQDQIVRVRSLSIATHGGHSDDADGRRIAQLGREQRQPNISQLLAGLPC